MKERRRRCCPTDIYIYIYIYRTTEEGRKEGKQRQNRKWKEKSEMKNLGTAVWYKPVLKSPVKSELFCA
jgi:hypothetical protein